MAELTTTVTIEGGQQAPVLSEVAKKVAGSALAEAMFDEQGHPRKGYHAQALLTSSSQAAAAFETARDLSEKASGTEIAKTDISDITAGLDYAGAIAANYASVSSDVAVAEEIAGGVDFVTKVAGGIGAVALVLTGVYNRSKGIDPWFVGAGLTTVGAVVGNLRANVVLGGKARQANARKASIVANARELVESAS